MKVALVVDHFQGKGGAERLEMILAEALDADVYTGYVLNESFNLAHLRVKSIFRRMDQRVLRYFFQRHAFRKVAKDLKNYDVVIYNGNSLDSAPRLPKSVKKILYCHTPPRHIYADFYYYLKQFPRHIQPFYRFYAWMYRKNYEHLIKYMDAIISNSMNIQKKLKQYTDHDSTVVYPPCDLSRFIWQGQQDYYFSFNRLEEVKRVDLIVKAFTLMPNKKLIVVSGGPELKKIQSLASGHSNIQIKGWVSEEELLELLGNCIATIYVPMDEDFGMGASESLSAGKPVIGSNEGGVREIVTKECGILLDETSVESIKQAVETLTPTLALHMKEACLKQAQKFSQENFVEGVKQVIYKL
ncbi:MAG: glycosyltransferase [Candidatus Abawacabacteria bacterium]|nr:glycosyltransferase [Candidatus Abawacabacteria bacterium]